MKKPHVPLIQPAKGLLIDVDLDQDENPNNAIEVALKKRRMKMMMKKNIPVEDSPIDE